MRRLLAALFVSALFTVAVAAQREATALDRAMAQMLISMDGGTVTFRTVARDDLKICVEPREGEFGRTQCSTIGELRRRHETAGR
jgi:hypothetical protein